jgi:hypothetical protein
MNYSSGEVETASNASNRFSTTFCWLESWARFESTLSNFCSHFSNELNAFRISLINFGNSGHKRRAAARPAAPTHIRTLGSLNTLYMQPMINLRSSFA